MGGEGGVTLLGELSPEVLPTLKSGWELLCNLAARGTDRRVPLHFLGVP